MNWCVGSTLPVGLALLAEPDSKIVPRQRELRELTIPKLAGAPEEPDFIE